MNFRRSHATCIVGLLAAAAAPIAAGGEEPARCSNRDFRGLYAYALSGSDLRNTPASALSASGAFRADGRGKITMWNDAFAMQIAGMPVKTVVPDVDMVAAAAAAGYEIVYTVAADCRIEIVSVILTPAGPVDLHIRGTLADGGDELLFQTGTPYIIGTGQAKRTATDSRHASRGHE